MVTMIVIGAGILYFILNALYNAKRNFYEYKHEYDGPDQISKFTKVNLRTGKVEKVSREEYRNNVDKNYEQWADYYTWKK